MKNYLPLFYLLLTVVFTNCSNSTSVNEITYFGGEIINPDKDYLLLFKDDVLLDTIDINTENRFLYKFDNVNPGLYYFKHKEYQYVYIEPSDSIMLRFNTMDFDESLTFSGKGAHKNNFLINTFLTNEKHTMQSKELFKNSPEKFSTLLNVELNQRIENLKNYKDRYNFSDKFMKIASAHINYHYYAMKERYALYNNKSVINSNFYDFRKNINLKDNSLGSFYPFYEYLYSFIDNISANKNSNTKTENKYLAKYTTEINVIDSLFKNEELKNQLLKNTTLDYLKNIKCEKNANIIYDNFNSLNTSEKNKQKITKLVKTIECLSVGKKLPEFNVLDINNDVLKFKNTLENKPTVIYFWSTKYPRYLKSSQQKINSFTKDTDYNFIGISLDSNTKTLKSYSKVFNFNYNYTPQETTALRKKLLIQSVNKIYVIDENTKILSTNMNLFDPNFVEKLNSLKKI